MIFINLNDSLYHRKGGVKSPGEFTLEWIFNHANVLLDCVFFSF